MASALPMSDTLNGSETTPHPAPSGVETSVFVMPATQGQVRFWSLDQLEPGNPGLNMPLMWQFTGPLDVPALRRAFSACAERHEMLRTTFDMVEGRLCQIIGTPADVDLDVVDLSDVQGEAQRSEADRLTKRHAAMRMDLKHGPLLQLQLLRLGTERHLLLLNMHHIICDGISLGILMRDMVAFYETAVQGSDLRLPELPIQFGDYAVWQEEWRASADAAASRDFWHRTLGRDFQTAALPQESAPTEDAVTSAAPANGDIETLLIPRDLTARAHAFCLRENITFNMLLFSVFVALIARLTGELEFTIGSPCANRTEDTDELIGMFMNIQVFRAQLGNESTFRDLLRQVETWTLGAYENQTLPFEDLVHDPFFAEGASSFEIPVFFLYQKSFMLTRRIGELEVVPLRSESPGAVFDVMFAIVDREEGPRLQLEFDPRKHRPATVQRWLRLYLNLLESGISDATVEVQQLNALSAAERRLLLTGNNETFTDFGAFRSIPAQVLAQARRAPERMALQCAGKEWTYTELIDYAQRLAGKLISEGFKAGDLIAICIDRSMEMVASMLAVLFAGGAYVPLDPHHPRERLELVLADCEPRFLLHCGLVEFSTAATRINVRTPSPAPPAPILASLTPASLAYVIYTSGTTGVPKGVAIEHGSIANLLNAMRSEPGLTMDDVLVAVTTPAFDIAALEIFLPLLTGARLVVATEQQVHEPRALLALLQQSKATVMQATPGAWHALADAGWDAKLPLKVLCGGDALSRPLADKLLERSDDVWNMYGPTETTVWSSATRVLASTDKPRLGKPLANTQFFLLDEHMQPVAIGFTGELYIGGAGLARGYWNKPQLTTERFVPNPFGKDRLYKTGDLARWHADLTLELLGRSDFQVKVCGYRIELGDIESALLRYPGVREAIVLQQRTDDTASLEGDERLIAYVEAGDPGASAVATHVSKDLEASLRRLLPDYMVPHTIVALPQLPRNTNGKLDRAALRDVAGKTGAESGRGAQAEAEKFFPPRDVIERQLTQIWQTTLGVPAISVRANFFSMGVSSLAALRLVTKMNRTFATDFGLATLLSAPSIEAVARLIRSRFTANTESPVVPIKPTGTKPPLFMVHGVGGNVISFHGLAMRLGPEQPVYGIQAQGLLRKEPGLLRLEDMAGAYIQAVRQVQPHGPYHFLGYSFGGTVALEMAHQLRARGEDVALLGMLDSKSTMYWNAVAANLAVHARISNRLDRFRGNTGQLEWKSRIRYISSKLLTRAARIAYHGSAALGMRRVPAFLKSAEDLNRVAIKRYALKPYDGTMTLFRASEQHDGVGPQDLGWSSFFRKGVSVVELPGDHERIFLEPMVEELAQRLRKTLDGLGPDERAS